MSSSHIYDRRRPCANCPFRCDNRGYLRRERAKEISMALLMGSDFYCHKTTIECGEEGMELQAGPDSQVCAGYLIVMEKMGEPNQMMRIAERLGMYDPERLDMDSPVFESLDEFISHHSL